MGLLALSVGACLLEEMFTVASFANQFLKFARGGVGIEEALLQLAEGRGAAGALGSGAIEHEALYRRTEVRPARRCEYRLQVLALQNLACFSTQLGVVHGVLVIALMRVLVFTERLSHGLPCHAQNAAGSARWERAETSQQRNCCRWLAGSCWRRGREPHLGEAEAGPLVRRPC